MSPLWLLFLALFPAPSKAARTRACWFAGLMHLGAEIEATVWLTEADLIDWDARLGAVEEALARAYGAWSLLRDRTEIVDEATLQRRLGAATAVLVRAAAARPERLRFARGWMMRVRRNWSITNRRRTPAFRRRRQKRPDAAALEFSG